MSHPRSFLKPALLAALCVLAGQAQATDQVTFNVTGAISVGTCSFSSTSVEFPLGTVDASTMPNVGDGSRWEERPLVSAGCSSGVGLVKMTFQGTADADNPQLFQVEGGAAGVGVELASYDNHPALPDNTTPIDWAPKPVGGVYRYKARYQRTRSAVVAGTANASITVNMTYE